MMSVEDTQILGLRNFSATYVARIFQVPPFMLAEPVALNLQLGARGQPPVCYVGSDTMGEEVSERAFAQSVLSTQYHLVIDLGDFLRADPEALGLLAAGSAGGRAVAQRRTPRRGLACEQRSNRRQHRAAGRGGKAGDRRRRRAACASAAADRRGQGRVPRRREREAWQRLRIGFRRTDPTRKRAGISRRSRPTWRGSTCGTPWPFGVEDARQRRVDRRAHQRHHDDVVDLDAARHRPRRRALASRGPIRWLQAATRLNRGEAGAPLDG